MMIIKMEMETRNGVRVPVMLKPMRKTRLALLLLPTRTLLNRMTLPRPLRSLIVILRLLEVMMKTGMT